LSRTLTRVAVVAAAACAALSVGVLPAAAKPPCWKVLINDWYDGHIDHVYSIACYHDAIKHMPTDLALYSNARNDIERALAQAVANQTKQPVTATIGHTTTTIEPSTNPTAPPATTTTKKNPFSTAIKKITPGGADAFPLPLLILGLLAILLVLAGVGGMLWRRYQGPPETP
jgi:hypothetical protein